MSKESELGVLPNCHVHVLVLEQYSQQRVANIEKRLNNKYEVKGGGCFRIWTGSSLAHSVDGVIIDQLESTEYTYVHALLHNK